VLGDATALRRGDIGGAADFFLDVGCFHHLPGPGRQAMAAAITAAAAPAATLLLLAFSPARRGPLPAGASRSQIQAAFPGWEILADQPADISGMPRPLRDSAPRWYRLRLSPDRAPPPVPVHREDSPEARVRRAKLVISRRAHRPGPAKYLNSGMLVLPTPAKVQAWTA
jgi:hypothetical protein